ncbi:C4-dicarboxylate TRAP transporter substrate-binding protein [Rhizobium halophytocola]|uniref:TRAP-type C4-dicarboxylate transport system substrate-binding protein n=1 Tax=Rhizobium halophytocola TaxID=735519 RepID=A0ABS4E645_9HYPH|nr:C4-dicarboxylate TRAP transporter substrate-binding protein [Rhizobium halophytocola]MBP1853417.1 TRAP-type C4-dicarboxylate transport system substrate-binding protein [Rhizobium halophytocola]
MALKKHLAGAVFAVVGATAAFATATQAETYKWITFKPQGAGDAQARSTQWYVDEFKKRTGGKDEIQVFWGGSVAKTGEIPDALGAGLGDFGDIITPYFPDRFPLNNAVGFFIPQPNGPLKIAELMAEWHEKYPQFEEELAKANIKAVGYRPLESYGLLCTKPVKTVEDLKGLRIRSYGFAYPALFEALGASPVSINTAEAYDALSRNIIDCTPIGPALARGWKYDEVAKYYIELPLGASFGHLIGMNLDTYNNMDEATRKVVDQLNHDYSVTYNKMLEDDINAVREAWKKDGVTVIDFDKNALDDVVKSDAVQAVRQQWIKRAEAAGVEPDEIVKQLQP